MPFDAEAWLSGLDPIGWRFGLERIRTVLGVLGMPQHRFASVHVVGTNGKSSVTAMTAALLEAHGRATGAYLSPHAERWSQRMLIAGAEIGASDYDAAGLRAAAGVAAAERTFERDEHVTQFEAATATAFVALAAAGVEVGVIEAGLGGRLDATNVLPSRVTALTSIGLDHTEWLGQSELEIAAEKLAVLRNASTLVLGDVSEPVARLAADTARERGARLVQSSEPPPSLPVPGGAPYQRRNLGVALAAAREIAGPLDDEAVRSALEGLRLPGKLELLDGDPPLIADAAHNPDGARALAEALPAVARGRPVIACLAVLADKDARAIMRELAPALDAAVCTQIPSARIEGSGRPGAGSVPAETLATLCRRAGLAYAESVVAPERALSRALELARERGGVALVAGSHYLLGYAWTARHAPSSYR